MARISKLVFDNEIVGYRTMFKSTMYDVDVETLDELGMLISPDVRSVELISTADGRLRSASEINHNQYVVDISGNLTKTQLVFRSWDISGRNQNDM